MLKEEAIYRAMQVPDSIPNLRMNVLREGLQATILKVMSEGIFFDNHSFMGGCALRFLFRHQRFSEDLNFSKTRKGFYRFSEDLDFEQTGGESLHRLAPNIIKKVEKMGYSVSAKCSPGVSGSPVEKVKMQFAGILKEARLSNMSDQKISIILESDSNPPPFQKSETSLIQSPEQFTLRHHDLPTLMAGKVAALLFRPFVKGRDWYDWLWYCGKPEGVPVEPNNAYLQACIKQNARIAGFVEWDVQDWKNKLREKIEKTDFPSDISEQIRKYLEKPEEGVLLSKENFLAALEEGVTI